MVSKKRYSYEFRDGVYEGGVNEYKRDGVGIALLDDGIVCIGEWLADKLHGKALILSSQNTNFGFLYGNFLRGE